MSLKEFLRYSFESCDGNCKEKVREIADMVNISNRSDWMILQENLGMKSLFKMGAAFAYNGRKATSRRPKELFITVYSQDLLHRHVIMDETWMHHVACSWEKPEASKIVTI